MQLYQLTNDYNELFNQFDVINSYEPEKNSNGEFVDDDGNIITDIDAWKNEQLTAWFDTMTGIEEEFTNKASNIAVYIKQTLAEFEAIKAEKKRLDQRMKSKENAVNSMKAYLLQEMKTVNIKKIDTVRAKISFSDGKSSVAIANEEDFKKWAFENDHRELLNFKEPDISKTAVLLAINNGEEIKGASIVRKPYITIK